jgi:GNAT superfamily N-acetyltransferase
VEERLGPYGLTLPPGHSLVSLAERPDLREPLGDFNSSAWPEFMLHDAIVNEHWGRLFADFAPFQMVLLDPGEELVAGLNSAPLAWDGTDVGLPEGWDDQVWRTVEGLDSGVPPDTLGALQIVVRADLRGSGYAGVMVDAMRANARAHGFRALIACVRPTGKVGHPLVPIDEYAHRTRADGLPEDAWIRLHVRLGGRIVRGAPASMRIAGSVADWEEWTGLAFPHSGVYVPEGAIAPVDIDLEADQGVYLDPNVWVVHQLA